jgi:hypothetical protein
MTLKGVQMAVAVLRDATNSRILPLAPIKLPNRDRAAKQLINEPDAVRVQNIALTIQGDFLDLPA